LGQLGTGVFKGYGEEKSEAGKKGLGWTTHLGKK